MRYWLDRMAFTFSLSLVSSSNGVGVGARGVARYFFSFNVCGSSSYSS